MTKPGHCSQLSLIRSFKHVLMIIWSVHVTRRTCVTNKTKDKVYCLNNTQMETKTWLKGKNKMTLAKLCKIFEFDIRKNLCTLTYTKANQTTCITHAHKCTVYKSRIRVGITLKLAGAAIVGEQ